MHFSPWVQPRVGVVPGSTSIFRGSGGASSALRMGRLFMRRISSFLKGQHGSGALEEGRNETGLAQPEQPWEKLPGQ